MTNKNSIALVLTVILVVGGIAVFSRQQKKGNSEATVESQRTTQDESSPLPTGADTDSEVTVETTIEPVKSVAEIALSISAPQSGGSVSTVTVAVKGKTSPKAEIFANEAEGLADANGNFSLTVALDEGENSIIVTAVDANGKVAEKEVLITYEVGE